MIRKLICLVTGLLLMLSATALAADDDMVFVDARGATGYYVDVSTIQPATATIMVDDDYFHDDGTIEHRTIPQERSVIQAEVAIIKAHENRRYLYLMQFDRGRRTYHILSQKIQQYDTKETIEEHEQELPEAPYAAGSMMSELADFVYEWPHEGN